MNVLHIDSGILGDHSVSRRLTAAIAAQLKSDHPEATVVYRDLVAEPAAHLSGAHLMAANARPEDVDAKLAAEVADGAKILEQFLAADTVIIGAPMYNFSIPSQLKAWLDRLGVPGVTFSYTEAGPAGLAGGRRVIVASSQGGAYEMDAPFEHHESLVRDFLAFIGVTDPVFIRADKIGFGPEARESSLARARLEIASL